MNPGDDVVLVTSGYAMYGLHPGMTGKVMSNTGIQNTLLVEFPGIGQVWVWVNEVAPQVRSVVVMPATTYSWEVPPDPFKEKEKEDGVIPPQNKGFVSNDKIWEAVHAIAKK